jgi:hypothetical protein
MRRHSRTRSIHKQNSQPQPLARKATGAFSVLQEPATRAISAEERLTRCLLTRMKRLPVRTAGRVRLRSSSRWPAR